VSRLGRPAGECTGSSEPIGPRISARRVGSPTRRGRFVAVERVAFIDAAICGSRDGLVFRPSRHRLGAWHGQGTVRGTLVARSWNGRGCSVLSALVVDHGLSGWRPGELEICG